MLGKDFHFFLLTLFFGCFLGFFVGFFFPCLFGLLHGVAADLFFEVCEMVRSLGFDRMEEQEMDGRYGERTYGLSRVSREVRLGAVQRSHPLCSNLALLVIRRW